VELPLVHLGEFYHAQLVVFWDSCPLNVGQ
jgi:hypothetical protein